MQIALVLMFQFALAFGDRIESSSNKVLDVADGDTVKVLNERGYIERIRLAGIDAPEKSQEFGRQSLQVAAALLLHKNVLVVRHGRDRYGRTIADVYLSNGSWINRQLVSAGCAWWFAKYSTNKRLRHAEEQARRHRRGLWSLNTTPMPPWEYRKFHRLTSQRNCEQWDPGISSTRSIHRH